MSLSEDVHLNLIESSRQLFGLDPGTEFEDRPGWLLAAGRSTHPMISNAAFRRDDAVDPAELLTRARDFFSARGRGFALWARSGLPEDRELIEAARTAGLQDVYGMPEMVLDRRPAAGPPGSDVEPRRVESAADAADYWRVATEAYASIGFPPEVFAFYENHGGLVAENTAAFLARADGEPVGIAMTIVTHGVAGIYWVGVVEGARGLGLGRAMTEAAVNAGFDLGAETASLQASPMGEPVYRAMGFRTAFDYRLLLSPPPGG